MAFNTSPYVVWLAVRRIPQHLCNARASAGQLDKVWFRDAQADDGHTDAIGTELDTWFHDTRPENMSQTIA